MAERRAIHSGPRSSSCEQCAPGAWSATLKNTPAKRADRTAIAGAAARNVRVALEVASLNPVGGRNTPRSSNPSSALDCIRKDSRRHRLALARRQSVSTRWKIWRKGWKCAFGPCVVATSTIIDVKRHMMCTRAHSAIRFSIAPVAGGRWGRPACQALCALLLCCAHTHTHTEIGASS